MQSSKEGLTARERVKLFKEGKPMSREERDRVYGQKRMWYEEGEDALPSQSRDATVPASSLIPKVDDDDFEVPRASVRGAIPQSTRLRNDGISRRRNAPSESLIESRDTFRPRALGASADVDYMIEQEIRNLEKDIKQKEKETMKRLNQGSFSPMRSLNRSFENGITSPATRHRAHDHTLGRMSEQLSRSGELFRTSADTLGGSGLLGLTKQELRLDGRKIEESEEDKVKSDKDKAANVQTSLEELLKNLKEQIPGLGQDGMRHPEDITIPEITQKLQLDILEFQSLSNGAMLEDKRLEEERKKRDNEMKEEGRKEEREKRLLEIDLPPLHPLEHLSAWADYATKVNEEGDQMMNQQQQQRDPRAVRFSDVHNNAPSYYHSVQPPSSFQPHPIPPSLYDRDIITMQHAVDLELNHADGIVDQMRHLRSNLGLKMRQLDSMYEAVMPQHNGSRPMRSDRGTLHPPSFMAPPPSQHPHRTSHPNGTSGLPVGVQPPGSRYWGMESYLPNEEEAYYDANPNKTWNPYPNLLPENIFSTARGIESVLNSAMDTLSKRLPEKRTTSLAADLRAHPFDGSRSPTPIHGLASVSEDKHSPRPLGSNVAPIAPIAVSAAVQHLSMDVHDPPPIKKDTTSSVEKIVDNIVATAKDKATAATINAASLESKANGQPSDAKSLASGHSLSVSADSVAGEKIISSSLGASKDSIPSVASSLSASNGVGSTSVSRSSGGWASALSKLKAGGAAALADPAKDLEYVDSVLEKGDKVRSLTANRFEKYVSPPAVAANPFAAPATSAASKTVTFATGVSGTPPHATGPTVPLSQSPTDAFHPMTQSTPTAAATQSSTETKTDGNDNFNLAEIDPLRELRQHRVYQNVLYRPGSYVDPYDIRRPHQRDMTYFDGYGDQSVPSAPPAMMDYTIQHSVTPQQPLQQQPMYQILSPQVLGNVPGTRPTTLQDAIRVASMEHTPLRRPMEGAAMMHRKDAMMGRKPTITDNAVYAPPPSQPYYQPTYPAPPVYTQVSSSGAMAREQIMSSVRGYDFTSGAPGRVVQVPSPDASTKEREAYLQQMKTLRSTMLRA